MPPLSSAPISHTARKKRSTRARPAVPLLDTWPRMRSSSSAVGIIASSAPSVSALARRGSSPPSAPVGLLMASIICCTLSRNRVSAISTLLLRCALSRVTVATPPEPPPEPLLFSGCGTFGVTSPLASAAPPSAASAALCSDFGSGFGGRPKTFSSSIRLRSLILASV